MRWLHSVWLVWISYKMRGFPWLVIYQGIPSKSWLAKGGLSDGLCLVCYFSETDAFFARVLVCQTLLEIFEDQCSTLP